MLANGTPRPHILGPVLNGLGGVGAIRDTDGGRYDGDAVWDRAVGPMQFIPGTWAGYGADGNGDGVRDPNNIDDAALQRALPLCWRRRPPRQAPAAGRGHALQPLRRVRRPGAPARQGLRQRCGDRRSERPADPDTQRPAETRPPGPPRAATRAEAAGHGAHHGTDGKCPQNAPAGGPRHRWWRYWRWRKRRRRWRRRTAVEAARASLRSRATPSNRHHRSDQPPTTDTAGHDAPATAARRHRPPRSPRPHQPQLDEAFLNVETAPFQARPPPSGRPGRDRGARTCEPAGVSGDRARLRRPRPTSDSQGVLNADGKTRSHGARAEVPQGLEMIVTLVVRSSRRPPTRARE